MEEIKDLSIYLSVCLSIYHLAVLHLAAEAITQTKKPRPHAKHYWNSNLSVLRKDIIFYRNIWLEEGKPRGKHYLSFLNFKEAKRCFRKAQRKVIYDDEIYTFERLENLHDIDRSAVFHKISRKIKPRDLPGVVLEVDGRRVDD